MSYDIIMSAWQLFLSILVAEVIFIWGAIHFAYKSSIRSQRRHIDYLQEQLTGKPERV